MKLRISSALESLPSQPALAISKILAFLVVIGLVAATTVQAQQPSVAVSQVPSPLSSLDGKQEQDEYYSATIPVTQLVAHEVDLRETLLAYSTEHQCSMTEAFLELAKKLGMSPLGAVEKNGSLHPPKNAVYKLVGNDVYSISAKQVFFNALQTELYQFRYGNQQIVVEVRIFQIPQTDVASVQSFMIPGSFKSFGNRLPVVEALANGTFANQVDFGQTENLDLESELDTNVIPATFVSATETRTKAFPTFIGHLDDSRTKKLVQFSKSRSSASMLQAPTVTMFPGQNATINDGSSRPFVVSVKKASAGDLTAYQPIVQSLEDGTKIAIQADIVAGKVKFNGDLAFSKVLGVETFDYPFAKDENGKSVTIQVPEHRIRKVHWSAEVESGNSILIDSVETYEKEIKPKTPCKAAATQTMRTLIMVTPRIVAENSAKENQAELNQ